jgi:arylsulfatase A-like enzyme
VHSDGDVNAYEGNIPGETNNQFPHRLSAITDKKFAALRYTPHGNAYTLEFARKTLENERLGKQGNTDLLAVSLSSPDYTGHVFGPNSMEVQDMYLRLDLELASFFRYLDSSYGRGNYLFFLTADHGVSQNPSFLNKHRMPGEVLNKKDWMKWLNDTIQSVYQVSKAVIEFENNQIYLQSSLRGDQGNAVAVRSFIVQLLKQQSYISQAFELEQTQAVLLSDDLRRRVNVSYHVRRSGDIQVIPMPNVFDGQKSGTTHGAWNPYDAHIPLVWMGWGIKSGKTHRMTHMADIASTLAALLNIQMPNGCQGQVITEVIP